VLLFYAAAAAISAAAGAISAADAAISRIFIIVE